MHRVTGGVPRHEVVANVRLDHFHDSLIHGKESESIEKSYAIGPRLEVATLQFVQHRL